MKIEIAVDHHEADEFASFLNGEGHDAHVGESTGNFIDGVCTSHDVDASDELNKLWDWYCNIG